VGTWDLEKGRKLSKIMTVVDTCIGYAAVLGAEVFTEMEGMVEEVSHLGFPVRDV